MTQQQALLPANAEPDNQDLLTIPEGLGPTDVQRIRQSLDSSVSENTRASYRSAWKTFERWAQARAALAMPAPLRRHRRDPQKQRPRGPHRQRGSPESDEGHRPGPRTGRKAGKTPYRRGPWRPSGPQRHPGAPWEPARSRNRRRELSRGPGWT